MNHSDYMEPGPVNEDLLDIVHAKTTKLYLVLGLLAFLCLVGTVGNALVLYVFSKKKDKMVSTLFILVLAIIDLTTCVAIIPFTIYMESVDFNVKSEIVCRVYHFFITFNIPFSALIMSAIALDRYLCICHPFLRLLTLKRAKIMTIGLALFAAFFGVITSLMYSVYHVKSGFPSYSLGTDTTEVFGMDLESPFANHTTKAEKLDALPSSDFVHIGNCAPNDVIVSMVFMWYYQKFYYALYIVCLIIIIVLYSLICKFVLTNRSTHTGQRNTALTMVTTDTPDDSSTFDEIALTTTVDVDKDETCATTNAMENGSSKIDNNSHNSKEEKQRKKSKKGDKTLIVNIKIALMLFVVTIVFIVTFLPALLMASSLIPFDIIVFYLYFANYVANPVIYSFMNRNFREELKRIFCKQHRDGSTGDRK